MLNHHSLTLIPLSEGFGQLESLRELNMANCKKLESLPEGFGYLASLEDLNMQYCTSVVSPLPASFCRLSNLKKLDLSSSLHSPMKLESLPEGFGKLRSLRTLNLECTSLLSLPPGLHTFQPTCWPCLSPHPPSAVHHP